MLRQNDYFYLIDKARSGDHNSMNQLFSCIQNNLYLYFYRTTKSYDLSHDLLQETLLTILKSITQLKKTENFWSWARRIAHSKIQQHLRDKQHRLAANSAAFNNTRHIKKSQNNNSVLKLVSYKEDKESLLSAVKQLKDEYRNVVELRCFEQMSHQRIASLTNTSCQQVRVKFHRAKRFLKDSLYSKGMTEIG